MDASNRLSLPGPLNSCLQDYARKTGRTPREIVIPLVEKRLLDVGYTEEQLLMTGSPHGESDTDVRGQHDSSATVTYYMLPASGLGMEPLEYTHRWLDHGLWGMGKSTPNRTNFKAGDKICFNIKGHGVSATATVTGPAISVLSDDEIPLDMQNDHGDVYGVPLTDVVWLEKPVIIDVAVRAALDAFKDMPVTGKSWAWLVQTSRTLTAHDYAILTGQIKPESATTAA